jgi:hypothetical protein
MSVYFLTLRIDNLPEIEMRQYENKGSARFPVPAMYRIDVSGRSLLRLLRQLRHHRKSSSPSQRNRSACEAPRLG